MRGYYKREGESDNIIDKDGFLHTGDIGYVDEDGFFYVVDRVKELIKCNGFQVIMAIIYLVIGFVVVAFAVFVVVNVVLLSGSTS